MDGIINLDKPTGISSANALYKIRSITRQKKSGHAGTLDPGASGVLVLCMGKGTKLVESIMDQPKVYLATARLDVTSETYDADRPLEPVEVADVPDADAVREAMTAFEGDIQQVPPRVSAIKIGGKPAYARVRRNELFEIKPRPARIYWLCLHAYDWPNLTFEMCCGRGTYVRSLIRDLGACLSAGGCLTSLARTHVGPFHRDNAWTIERIGAAPEEVPPYLIPLDEARDMLDKRPVVIPNRPV